MKKGLAIICSYNPTETMVETVKGVIKCYPDFDITIIDSDSSQKSKYEKVEEACKPSWTKCSINFCKNKNYEMGAWKIGLESHPDYDVYMCIQDVTTPVATIENLLDLEDDLVLFHSDSNEGKSGFLYDRAIESTARLLIQDTDYVKTFDKLAPNRFVIATHNLIIATKNTLSHFIKNLPNLPINKGGSCSYERLLGLAALHDGYRIEDVSGFFRKSHQRRT